MAALVQRGSEWAKVLTAPALVQGLGPIFDSVFRRTVWSLRLQHGTLVELALDQGELRRGHAHEPISEIKLMLKAGDPAALFDFALQLQDKVRLRVANLSKAARGYALLAPQPSTGAKAGAVELASAMTVDQGFRAVVSTCATPTCWLTSPLPGWPTPARPKELLPLKQAASMIARAKRRHAASVGSVRYSRMVLGLVAWLQSSRWRESPEKPHPELANSAAFARGFLCCRTNQEVRELAELWEQCSAMNPP